VKSRVDRLLSGSRGEFTDPYSISLCIDEIEFYNYLMGSWDYIDNIKTIDNIQNVFNFIYTPIERQ
jgi:hypothetical protein